MVPFEFLAMVPFGSPRVIIFWGRSIPDLLGWCGRATAWGISAGGLVCPYL